MPDNTELVGRTIGVLIIFVIVDFWPKYVNNATIWSCDNNFIGAIFNATSFKSNNNNRNWKNKSPKTLRNSRLKSSEDDVDKDDDVVDGDDDDDGVFSWADDVDDGDGDDDDDDGVFSWADNVDDGDDDDGVFSWGVLGLATLSWWLPHDTIASTTFFFLKNRKEWG